MAWTETWLSDAVASSELEAALPGHMLFRRDRAGRVGGGVSCFADRALCPERREALEPRGAEMLVVSVQTTPPMLLAVCYCPPDDAAALAATMTGLSDLVGAASSIFLDLTLSNGQNIVTTVRNGVFPSDHKEVVCELSAVRVPVPVVSRGSALNHKRADWAGLREALRRAPWEMLDGLTVDDATDKYVLRSADGRHQGPHPAGAPGAPAAALV